MKKLKEKMAGNFFEYCPFCVQDDLQMRSNCKGAAGLHSVS